MSNTKMIILSCFAGLLLNAFIACNPSSKDTGNNPNTSEVNESKDVQPMPTENLSVNTDDQSPVRSISSEQFIELVSDYRKEWHYKGNKPCVVDFYADWCRPCRIMEPAFKKVAEQYAGKVDFYKINVDSNEEIADVYQIMGIPSLFFCASDGNLIRIAGALTEEQIKDHVEMIVPKQ
jgi:thioredoxin